MSHTSPLYTRFLLNDSNRIPPTGFCAALADVLRGRVTLATLAAHYQLTTSSQTADLQALHDRVHSGGLGLDELRDVLIMADQGIVYTTTTQLRTRLNL